MVADIIVLKTEFETISQKQQLKSWTAEQLATIQIAWGCKSCFGSENTTPWTASNLFEWVLSKRPNINFSSAILDTDYSNTSFWSSSKILQKIFIVLIFIPIPTWKLPISTPFSFVWSHRSSVSLWSHIIATPSVSVPEFSSDLPSEMVWYLVSRQLKTPRKSWSCFVGLEKNNSFTRPYVAGLSHSAEGGGTPRPWVYVLQESLHSYVQN